MACLLLSAALSVTPITTFKKGVGGGGMCGDLEPPAGLSSVSWFYDWGHSRKAYSNCTTNQRKDLEYVPMIWGKWALSNATNVIRELTELTRVSPIRSIFGFNEPDHSGSYLKPQDAAERWPAMEHVAESLNLTLISPCVS